MMPEAPRLSAPPDFIFFFSSSSLSFSPPLFLLFIPFSFILFTLIFIISPLLPFPSHETSLTMASYALSQSHRDVSTPV